MARKRVRKPSVKKASKSAKKPLEKNIEHFSSEVEALGKHLEKHVDLKSEEWDSWFHRTLGPVGPLISSIFGMIALVFGVWVLGLVNFPIGSGIVTGIRGFILDYVGWFFLLFLLFSYTSYLSRAKPHLYWVFSPISTAVGVVFTVWLIVQVFSITSISIPVLDRVLSFANASLIPLFLLVLIIGFVVSISKNPPKRKEPSEPSPKPNAPASRIHRLYRSGNDKILGGVCGGIGEYLGIDPVIIRMLWIVAIFMWGAGILAYIIAWIIIPRNPKHKWND